MSDEHDFSPAKNLFGPPDLSSLENCLLEHVTEGFVLVIFGATGDLTARKLLPAVCALLDHGILPEDFAVVGVGRTQMDHEAFRSRMREKLQDHPCFPGLEPRLFYHATEIDNTTSFGRLALFLDQLEEEQGIPPNRLFYMAVPPEAYEDVADGLGASALSFEERGWARLVVEKPFGHDLKSAHALDSRLHQHFQEHQIFRIDHYLAKETVQNILVLRFANALFEPLWNRNYIDHISIVAAEQMGVEHRAGYYEKAGVLRDMFQNHMMQLLALCAMEPPSRLQADQVRDEKTKLYRALKPFPVDRIDQRLVLGQYTSGMVKGRKVPGYVDEERIAPDSAVPTFATMQVYVDNWRWRGVPFYLTSGKRLAEKRTEIAVQFKDVPHALFGHLLGGHISANRLVLSIQPREGVTLTFQAKEPGPLCLRTVPMHFDYNQGSAAPGVDAYSKVLMDCLLGDHTLFWRQDGVELCWGFLSPILEECDCPDRLTRLHLYRAGSWGPQAADALLPEPLSQTFSDAGR